MKKRNNKYFYNILYAEKNSFSVEYNCIQYITYHILLRTTFVDHSQNNIMYNILNQKSDLDRISRFL